MSLIKTTLKTLEENPKSVFNEATRLLVKIADNILKEPTNLKIRSLHKNNPTVSSKLLNISGALDCLKIMGFEEKDAYLILPPCASLTDLESIRNEISKCHNQSVKVPLKEDENVFKGLVQSESSAVSESKDASLASSSSSDSSSDDNEPDVHHGAIPKVKKDVGVQKKINSSAEKSQPVLVSRDAPTVNLPPITHIFSNPFLQEIETSFHMALAYKDKDLLERGLRVIPVTVLENNGQKKLRLLQEQVKKGCCADQDVSLQDILLLELLFWFKSEFFTWVDSPDCIYCKGKTEYSHMSDDSALQIHTKRIEMHKCKTCKELTPFPRYNDVNILLMTRRGRCGEWANTFTLLCCSMGWDARLVVDEGDHVWTEVYSFAQKRWLHCDPCENICDTPLIYENGWQKQLSYVMAYSSEEVQDVTWRYSSYHKYLLNRRTRCTENDLACALIKLRENRQKSISQSRRDYLTKRLLHELVELMVEKKPNESDKQGRNSGSLAWRISRGEIQESESSYSWTLSKDDVEIGDVTIRYSAALDKYEYMLHDGSVKMALDKWYKGIFSSNDISRKEELDWKMVYLARKEHTTNGTITWKFTLDHPKTTINTIDLKFEHQVFENGNIEIQVQGDKQSITFPSNLKQFKTSLAGSKSVTISANLTDGKGDVAWQHAQLFRQSMTSKEYPFSITFTFI